jgi:2-dehydropantoate 2-reductase
MPGQLSSTAQDLQRGRPTEIDHLNGVIVCQEIDSASPCRPIVYYAHW